MRTIEDIREEKLITEQEVYYLKEALLNEEIRSVDKDTHDLLQEKISSLQKEINSDTLYIKNTYNQLLKIRSNAEFLLRQKDDRDAKIVSDKVHQAFLLLVEYSEKLNEKIAEHKRLLEQCAELIKQNSNNSTIQEYKNYISEGQRIVDELNEELKEAENQHSISVEAKNRVIKELREYQEQIQILENKIKKHEAQISALSRNSHNCKCGSKIELRMHPHTKDIFWGCPNFKEAGVHSRTEPYYGDKDIIRQIFEELNAANQARSQINPPVISLERDEKAALQNTTVILEEYPESLIKYPNIAKKSYSNYLFQSLAVPSNDISKNHFNELLEYSRFRVFTELPKQNNLSDETRTIYSLALRLLNRGIVLPTCQKTLSKIKRIFDKSNVQTFVSSLNDYITYNRPQNRYDSDREKDFAEYYFPLLLGESWATYVYTQMPIKTLIKPSKEFKNQRVDFFVCYRGRKIIIELDGEEHKNREFDRRRDEVLKENDYKVVRFSNKDVDERTEHILNKLKGLLKVRHNGAILEFNKKYLVACKLVHQIAIAILKMLEEDHISTCSNLNLELSSELFTSEETKLLLLFAVEEVTEMLQNFAELYGVDFKPNFFDENAEKYSIKIGDGDDNRNTIVIRDIVLPLNYLCSIHPFALILPQKESVTEDVLEYFLQYVYGYAQFRAGQFAAIRRTLRREESIVLLPTGSGKSVIYQLCSMLLPGITVVISPLRALIEDQVSNLADKGINNVAAIYSMDDENSKEEMLKKASAIMNNHSAMMLYIAPERMQMPDFRKEIKLQLGANNFCLVAIDEAHCVSEWGHDFRAPYLQIGRSCRKVFKKKEFVPPIIALTGTASDNVLRDVKRDLEITNNDAIISPPSFDREELKFSVIPCQKEDKFKQLNLLLNETLPSKFDISQNEFKEICGKKTRTGIVFTPLARKPGSTYAAWDLFCRLNAEPNGLSIGTYFSSPPFSLTTSQDEKRDEIWQSMIKSYAKEFKENKKQLLIATKAFGMGIDKSNIRYVIHYGLSTSIEQYYQEVGRAGRDGSQSHCVMLFSSSNESNNIILNPNLYWCDFKEQYDKHYNDGNDSDDLSPMLYFHINNFKGAFFEKTILSDVLSCIKEKCTNFDSETECVVSVYNVYRKNQDRKNNDNISYDNFANNVAKAIIRLVTLGVLKDYEYDYSQKEYHVVLGNIDRESVLNHYLNFVDGCSRGRIDDEKSRLANIQGDNFIFLDSVADRYIDLVYETIEKGRRRALQSMYRLAKESSKITDSNAQDKYIRTEIQNYLVKDDTVDIVNSSDTYTGIYEILQTYPLYPNDVVIDVIEQENAKKTSGYAARVLESNPYHPGLLYLNAITAIKSGIFDKNYVRNDIIEALQNSDKYSIPIDISTKFFVKVLNLTFNSSANLFEFVWDSVNSKYFNSIIDKALELTSEEISDDFKEYLVLHIKSQALRKIIGGEN